MLFPITTFTLIHTLLSVIGIFAGLVLAGGWLSGKQLERWSLLFLVTTFLTNLSGFGFPFTVLLPGHVIGALSLLILPFVVVARYGKHLAGGWRKVYVIGSMVLLYFNAFILVVQLFKRIPGLIAAAPTQKEPPFAITQLIVLALFLWLGREAVKGSRGALG
jgi:hypothetical protein